MATYRELLTQREALDKEIEAARQIEVVDAIKQVKALIVDFGLTAAQCGFSSEQASTVSKSTKTVKPKYVTPDGLHHWTGRGNPPVAFKTLFEAGHKKEDFLIKNDNA